MTSSTLETPAPSADVPVRAGHGTVKWYSVAKGYGFIAATDEERDVFVHHSQLGPGEELLEGDEVRFELFEGPKGLQARAVQVVG